MDASLARRARDLNTARETWRNMVEAIGPWLQEHVNETSSFSGFAAKLPFAEKLAPHADEIRARLTAAAERVGIVVAGALPNAARGAADVVFQLFLMLYATFFFLRDGRAVLNKILYYLPLGPEDEERMLDKSCRSRARRSRARW
jgi:predicted PurR-regulated permease PerM